MSKSGIIMHEDVSYRGEGEDFWKLDLALPCKPARRPVPCVVIVHGGGWRSCDKRSGLEVMMMQHLPELGLAGASVEYRLSTVAPFPAQLIDVRCAVRFLRSQADAYGIDAARMAGLGHSAGGHLVALAGLARDEDWVEGGVPAEPSAALQAVVGLSGAYDLRAMLPQHGPQHGGVFGDLLPGPAKLLRRRAAEASPISYARADAPPFLLCHGDADEVCSIRQARAFERALRRAGAPDVTLHVIKAAGHGVAGSEGVMPLIDEFIKRVLLASA